MPFRPYAEHRRHGMIVGQMAEHDVVQPVPAPAAPVGRGARRRTRAGSALGLGPPASFGQWDPGSRARYASALAGRAWQPVRRPDGHARAQSGPARARAGRSGDPRRDRAGVHRQRRSSRRCWRGSPAARSPPPRPRPRWPRPARAPPPRGRAPRRPARRPRARRARAPRSRRVARALGQHRQERPRDGRHLRRLRDDQGHAGDARGRRRGAPRRRPDRRRPPTATSPASWPASAGACRAATPPGTPTARARARPPRTRSWPRSRPTRCCEVRHRPGRGPAADHRPQGRVPRRALRRGQAADRLALPEEVAREPRAGRRRRSPTRKRAASAGSARAPGMPDTGALPEPKPDRPVTTSRCAG